MSKSINKIDQQAVGRYLELMRAKVSAISDFSVVSRRSLESRMYEVGVPPEYKDALLEEMVKRKIVIEEKGPLSDMFQGGSGYRKGKV